MISAQQTPASEPQSRAGEASKTPHPIAQRAIAPRLARASRHQTATRNPNPIINPAADATHSPDEGESYDGPNHPR